MRTLRRLALLAAALCGVALASLPPPPAQAQIAALPDSERRTRYTITDDIGPFDVGFAIYGDGTDYQNWLEVYLDGVKLTPVTDWTLILQSGTLATSARPITNAQVKLSAAGTGTLDIVGARRPRRTSQFQEGVGITARGLNQVLTDLTAQERERWDRDLRTLMMPPGNVAPPFPTPSANKVLGWNSAATGLENLDVALAASLIKATSADAIAGTDDARYMTPAGVTAKLSNFPELGGPSFTGRLTSLETTAGIALGAPDAVSTPLIDFLSSGNASRDYDARLYGSGGSATNGTGYLNLSGTFRGLPPAGLNHAIDTAQTVTGTTAGDCTAYTGVNYPCVNKFEVAADDADASGGTGALDYWQFVANLGGANLKGYRQAFDIIANFSGPSSTGNASKGYVAMAAHMVANTDDGGTAPTLADGKGAFFGINPVVIGNDNARNLQGLVGSEIDVHCRDGCTTAIRFGESIANLGNRQASTLYDSAINVGSGLLGGEWKNALILSNINGAKPLDAAGCVICTDGTANTIGKGIDLSAYTITGDFLKANGFSVNGSGFINTVGLIGVTNASSATAGSVGEVKSSTVTFAAPVQQSTSGTAINVTSVSLTAGDWMCWANLGTNAGATTQTQLFRGDISLTSATLESFPNGGAGINLPVALTAGQVMGMPVGRRRVNVSSTTTVYLVGNMSFTISTMFLYGHLACERAR